MAKGACDDGLTLDVEGSYSSAWRTFQEFWVSVGSHNRDNPTRHNVLSNIIKTFKNMKI